MTKQLQEFSYSTKIVYNIDCGLTKLQLMMHNSSIPAPAWVKVDETSRTILVDTNSLTEATSSGLDLLVSLAEYPDRKLATNFNVTLSSCEI